MHLIKIATTSISEAIVANTSPAVRGAPSEVMPCIEAAQEIMTLAIPVYLLCERCNGKAARLFELR